MLSGYFLSRFTSETASTRFSESRKNWIIQAFWGRPNSWDPLTIFLGCPQISSEVGRRKSGEPYLNFGRSLWRRFPLEQTHLGWGFGWGVFG